MSPRVSKEHMEQRRANILEAAKDVFIEHGYERATMKHIMVAAGVSRGGLYQYFSNKEDVYESILQEALSMSLNETMDSLKENVTSHWEMLLKSMFGEGKKPNDKMDPLAPSNLEFFITGRTDQRRREYAKERYSSALKLYASIIEQGQKIGEFSSKYDSEVVAQSIITFTDGLALDHSILSKDEIKLKEQSVLLVEYLKMALGVK